MVARFSEKADVGTLLEAWDASPEQAIAATVGADDGHHEEGRGRYGMPQLRLMP